MYASFPSDTYKLPVLVLYMKVVQLYQGGWEYSVGGVEGMPPTENINLRIFMGIYLPKNINYSLYFDQLFWYGKNENHIAVLRIHLVFMRIRIRILDPHWKKMDPDPEPGHFFKINWIFFNKK